ncbi:hypothetical protein [Nocardioides luteus]|uniref:hypothetical protein n=1 Tax=Nocardioides luteus TaxID=1844 RepID=UPI0018C9081F|nr:hypothetical protein [Nocardioides luteus]MBG6095390.1 hypothetical protein [Nocardioides luteus]
MSDLDPRLLPVLGLAERAAARPGGVEVDLETLREIFAEAAMLLDLGNVLDELDAHDAHAVVDGLCADLLADDPAASIRAHAELAIADTSLHDPEASAVAYRMAAHALRL